MITVFLLSMYYNLLILKHNYPIILKSCASYRQIIRKHSSLIVRVLFFLVAHKVMVNLKFSGVFDSLM